MSGILRINLDDLLHRRTVESVRIEFKAGWDERTTASQVLKTICAFANDYQNLNGGYVVIGVEEREGRAVLPPAGLDAGAIERAQKWLRGRCKAMKPEAYEPVFSPEVFDGRDVLVVWAPASKARPHRAPDANGRWKYWVRIGAETVDAESGGRLEALLEQTARVPWDDRAALDARLEDLRETRVREYLRDAGSGLLDVPDATGLYRRMHVTTRVNDHEVPRNVGLLFFCDEPDGWFRGAKIEVVRFAADRAGDVQDERIFRGPLADQLRNCLGYLESLSHAHLKKERDRSQVQGWVSYPQIALREVLVNAVYHRAYREDVVEPTKVHLYPDRIEVISYPGPVPGIEKDHLSPDRGPPPVPARNRRIGEFLKELRLAEGRLTGLPKIYAAMEHNGSPAPGFDFDAGRSYFRATLPAHPEYAAVSAIQDAAYLRTVGRADDAFKRVENAWKASEASAALAIEMVRLYAAQGRWDDAGAVYARFREGGSRFALANVANVLIEALINGDRSSDARSLLDDLPDVASARDAMDSASLAQRLGNQKAAHRYFERAGDAVLNDTRALHEFARTKIRLAQDARRQQVRAWRDVNKRLLREARELLERVVQMDAPPARHAWAWRELARTLDWLRASAREVEAAFETASKLLPDEPKFKKELDKFRSRRKIHPPRRGRSASGCG